MIYDNLLKFEANECDILTREMNFKNYHHIVFIEQ